MKYLAVDTSTRHLSLALAEDGRVFRFQNVAPQKDLSLSIATYVERFLRKAGFSLDDLEAFVFGLGPGSFTGLRVGASMLKAFGLVTGKPVVGVSSLDAIAMNAVPTTAQTVCVVVDARRELLYCCLYERQGAALLRRSDYVLQSWQELEPRLSGKTLFIGDAIPLFQERISATAKNFVPCFAPEKTWRPQARSLAVLAWDRLKRGDVDSMATLTPMYLYPEDCQVQGKKK